MKNLAIFLLFFLLCFTITPASTFKLGVDVGYFSPADEQLTEIYDGGDVMYGLKLGIRLWDGLSLQLSARQFRKTAGTTLLGDTTIFKLNPIHLSLRYTIRLGGVNPYVEGGYARILYDEQSEIGHVKGEGKGFCAEAGLEFKLSSGFVIEAGAGYNQAVVNPTGFDVELGGWRAGLAFLVAF